MSPTFDLTGIDLPSTTRLRRDWSPQQQAIFAEIEDQQRTGRRENLRIDAVAGAGKTTTLIEACFLMEGLVALLAFNKRIADATKERVIGQPLVKAGTFHAFGLAAWKQLAPRADVFFDKIDGLMEELNVPTWQRAFVGGMVSLAKQAGIGLAGYPDITEQAAWVEQAEWFDLFDRLGEKPSDFDKEQAIVNSVRTLEASIESSLDVIDFDDMLYMPLLKHALKPIYDWVLIDEAQDTNALRRKMAAGLLKPGGRLIAVGDPHQAIYGFTGADAEAMNLISSRFACKSLPLTVTYRCPKLVVARAREWVDHIQAHVSAPEGIVRTITPQDFVNLAKEQPAALDKNSVVLCRNTKPLIEHALRMIRAAVPCRVEGRDIGTSLVKLATRWKSVKTLSALYERLDTYCWEETQRLIEKGRKVKVAQLEDRVASLQAIINSLDPEASIYTLRQKIESLFGDTEGGGARVLTLSTIHKAKGREWDRVYWLSPDLYQPSKYATKEWEKVQENNLMYVAVTRAKKELVEIRSVATPMIEEDYDVYIQEAT